jgi:5-methylcytosine-specific restriction endonuclease McrA
VSKGSTRRRRKARALLLATATHCWICGQPPRPGDPLVADHLIPRAHGGPDALFNYRAAHRSCNARRGAKWPMEPAPLRVKEREPDPTPETHPNLIFDTDRATGKTSWWPRHSRDW